MIARLVSIFLVMIMSFNSPVVCNAAYSDAIDIVGIYAGKIFDDVFMGESNKNLLDKVKKGIEDPDNKDELINYIAYTERNQTDFAMQLMTLPYPLAIWCDRNIPLLGGVVNILITTPALYIGEWMLSSGSDREDIQAFDTLRGKYISSQFAVLDFALEERSYKDNQGDLATIRKLSILNEAEQNEIAYREALTMAHVKKHHDQDALESAMKIQRASSSIWDVLCYYVIAILMIIYGVARGICLVVLYYLGW